MTEGEYKVGISFNPSNKSVVSDIKEAAAWLIDMIEKIGMEDQAPGATDPHSERRRLKALAITNIENGAMWAVKAATKPARED